MFARRLRSKISAVAGVGLEFNTETSPVKNRTDLCKMLSSRPDSKRKLRPEQYECVVRIETVACLNVRTRL